MRKQSAGYKWGLRELEHGIQVGCKRVGHERVAEDHAYALCREVRSGTHKWGRMHMQDGLGTTSVGLEGRSI